LPIDQIYHIFVFFTALGGQAVASTFITNIGTLATGAIGEAPLRDTTIVIEDGVVTGIGMDCARPDRVIDAGGQTALPGFVDGHVHPTFGEWTPAQNSIGWVHNYLHGGTTTMVSAGELHVPGLPFDELEPRLVLSLALVSRATTGRVRPSGVKAYCGTVLLVPGLKEDDFDLMVERDIKHLKFIFYDWDRSPDGEAQDYVRWARERGLIVKIHSGGVSRSGSSRIAGYDVVTAVDPDVIAHVSGGPIPMPDDEIRRVIDDLPEASVEVCSSMNYRATQVVVDHLTKIGRLDRLTLGTDTPGGTGVIPRGMLRNICFLASVCGMDPADSVAAASGNTARRHDVPGGLLAEGQPADLVLCGPVLGSRADDALGAFALGDLPAVSLVMVDGEPLVAGRSEQTPPARSPIRIS
jgi:enamidase